MSFGQRDLGGLEPAIMPLDGPQLRQLFGDQDFVPTLLGTSRGELAPLRDFVAIARNGIVDLSRRQPLERQIIELVAKLRLVKFFTRRFLCRLPRLDNRA